MNKRYNVLISPFSPLKLVLMVVLSWFSFTYCNAQLITNENATNADIANLISGTGLDITNFTIVSGQNSQIGTFSYPMDAVLGLDQGMVISTGDLNQLVGPNNEGGSSIDNLVNYNDPDLLAIEPNCNNDVVVIEFDVVPKCDTLLIDFQFASEEYPEYVCSTFNDAFAFLVSGPGIAGPYTDGAANFAILPDGTDVTINGVNDGGAGTAYPLTDCSSLTNTAFYTDNTGGADLQFDGFTAPLQAKGVVVPCQTYHVKILLGDSGDGVFDSAVFLKSFSCPSQAVSLVPDPVFSDAIEGCQFGLFNLTRSGDTTVPLSVDFTLSGTAASSDYTFEDLFGNSVSSPLNYAADEVDKFLLIRPVSDALTEGNETVDLNLTWFQCSDSFTLTETINLIDNFVDIECQNDTTIYVNSGTCTKDFDFSFPTVDSNCSASLSRTDGSGLNSGDDFPLGTTTIGWRAEANGGLLSSECTFDVTVVDDEDPVAQCQNITLELNSSGTATMVASDLNDGSTDNCSIAGYSASQTSFDCSDLGANLITLTVTDGSGNTHSCVATVTVEDNIAPVDITLSPINVQCSTTLVAPTTTDNCGGALTATTSDPTTYNAQGSYTVTWTFNDGNGNTSTEVQSVNVADTAAPNAVCQNITAVLDGSGNVSITPAQVDNGSTDNCTVASMSLSQTSFDCGDVGANSVTLTVTDAAGNTDTCVATVNVRDTTDPSLTTQNVTIQLDATGNATTTAAALTVSTADICGAPTVTVDQTTFNCSDLGTNTVNVTATDVNGNTTTETAVVTVEDNIAPVDITLSPVNAQCSATLVAPTTTDNCGGTLTATTSDPTTYNAQGSYTVTWTFNDGNGNTSTEVQTVNVADTAAPNAVCQNRTITLNAAGNASITAAFINNGSTDNCNIASLVASQTTFDCTDIGPNNITLTVTDDAGNVNTCVAIVTVTESTNPTLTTQNVTVQLDGSGSASITPADVTDATSDNCGTPTVTVDQTTFDCTEVGAVTVNVTSTDAAGNSITETATVTVEDNEAPVAVCANITVGLDGSGNATITASELDGGSTDNCGIASITASTTSFTSADLGANNVTLTVTDVNGNTDTCVAVVTVSDANPPNAICQNVTIQLDASGNASIVAADLDGGSTDNGVITSITASQTAFDCTDLGANSVTLTVTDDAGNTDTCVATVTVEDSIDPSLTTQNVTVQLDGSGSASITPADVTDATSDNCDAPTVTVDQTTFDCTEVGAVTVNVTSTDAAGNSITETATVTVEDIEAPVAVCANITVGLDGSGNATITASELDGGSTDNCGIASITASTTSFTSADLGANNVTLTVTDDNGNTDTCVAVVTVSDANPPNAICQNVTIQLDASGNASIIAADLDGGSTDNGVIASITASQTAFDCTDLGANSVTLTVTDDAGNTDTCVATVTVEDSIDPSLTTQNVTVQLDGSGSASITPADVTDATSDNCGTPTVTVDQTTFDCTEVGAVTVNVTSTDAAGNSITETATVTVEDNEAPVAVCANITVGLDGSGNATITASELDGGSTDNCGIASITASTTSFTSADLGANNVTLTVTDDNGNTDTCVAVVTVSDANPPNAICQDVTIQLDASGTASIVAADLDGGSTDNGVITSITASQTTFDCTDLGANSVTLTVTDDAGNTDTCVATVTVEDSIDPSLTTQNVTVQLDGSGSASITPADVTDATSDNCGTPTVTVDQTTFDCTEVGAVTVNVTSTDAAGNSITETATVTVEDNEAPVAVCANITVGLDGSGNATITASELDGGSTDNCGIASITASTTSFTSADLGANNVTLTVTDDNGNTDTCVAVVTVSDANPPNAICQNVTIQLDASGTASIIAADLDGGSTDNGVIASITASQTAFDCTDLGANSVTLTVTDDAGNTDTCVATVTVEDSIDPSLTTQNVTVQLDGSGSASITPADVTDATSDNCGTPTVTVDQTTFDCTEVGAVTVNVTSTDAAGNSITETATVTVEDNVDPTAVCLDITVGLDGSGNATITAADIDGGSTDNCGIASITASTTSFTSADLGANNVTLTVTDDNGNTDTCVAVVTVSDANPPNAICQNVTIQLDASGTASIIAADLDGGSTDNGVITSITASQTAFDCTDLGANNVILTVTDDAGNTDTCVATVTVEDSIDPSLTTQNVTVQLDGSGSASITPADVTDATSDNCGTPTVTVDQTTFDCTEVGAVTVNVTSTDAAGNSITETATVTVEDNEAPVAVCANITVGLDGSGNATITASELDGGSTDNCGIASITASTTSFTSADLGANNVTLTVTDDNGNTDTCVAVVTVSDANPPNAICQNVTIQLDASGNASIIAADLDGGSTDNGVITSITASQTAFDCTDLGANSVTLTVTDDAGNTDTCVATVTVEDNIDPSLTTQNVTVQLDGSGSASITPADVTDATSDNCGTPTVTVDQTTFDCTEVGAVTVNVTSTDAAGNSITETATVTVEDNEAPVAVCANITVGLDGSGNATITASELDGGSTDNCGIASITASTTSFTSADLGANNVTLTVTDDNGNTDTCVAVVTVSDANPPNAICQDVTIQLDASGNASIVAADLDGGSTDNGVITSITASQTAFDCTDLGANNVTLTVTDDAGNTDTCVATVTVEDNIDPSLTTQNVTVQLDGSGSASITPEDVTDATSDNCGTPTVTVDQTTFDCTEVGAVTVNVTSTDAAGNSITETATVTVEDNEAPVAVCANITVGLDGSGNATITASELDGGSTDNCGIASITASTTSFTSADLGANNVTLTVTDDNGNTDTCVAVVTVSDANPPNAICQNVTIQLDASGNASIIAADLDGGSTDNGAIVSLVASQTAFDCTDLGANNVTLTVTDDAGNTDTCVATVTVEDSIDPSLTTQNATIYLDDSGEVILQDSDVTDGVSDNCATQIISLSAENFDCIGLGANTVDVTMTDGAGNSITEPADVTVVDAVNPTAVCSDVTLGINLLGIATLTPDLVDGGSFDNCTIVNRTVSPDVFSLLDLGLQVFTLTVEDQSGNLDQCTASVMISDSNPPNAVCQDITVELDEFGNASIAASDIDGGSTDNGTIVSVTASQTAFDCTNLGPNNVTLTVTDDAGNSSTCVAIVTVEDNLDPILTTQDITVQLDGTGNITITAADVTASSANNCGAPVQTIDVSTFDCTNLGPNTVNVTSTDQSGNSVNDTAVVTVEDSENPVAVCLDITVGLDEFGNASIIASDVDGGSTDNCTIVDYAIDVTSFTSADLGPNNVVLTVTDQSGNTDQCTAVVTVSDANPPNAVCQDITVELDEFGNASIVASDIDGGSTDNGIIVSVTASQTAFDCTNLGAINVTLTVTDDAGNSSTCVAIVTVEDNLDPILTTQDITVQLDGTGNIAITAADVTASSANNCGAPVQTIDVSTFDCSNLGPNTVNVTSTDQSGNSVTDTAVVTVEDSENPVAVCLDITAGLDEFGNASIIASDVDGGSTDNCTIVDYAIDITSFTSADLGPNNVVLTVTDQSGNTDQCTAVVTVSDSNPPNAVCQDITVELDEFGNASIVASDIDGGSTDNGTIVSVTASQTSFDCTNLGANNVTLTVTDDAGNSSTCVAIVTVEDNLDPILTTQDITVQLDGTGNIAITAADVTSSSANNCGAPVETIDISSFDCSNLGPNVVTVSSTDQSGNSVSDTAVVTVEDSENPVAVCLDITVGLDEFGNASIAASDVDGGSTDNCTIVDYAINVTSFTSADLGPNNVVLTVTDQSGNTDQCTAVVTVSDSNPPNAVCQDIIVELDEFGNASIVASDIDGGSTDNGTIVSVTASQTDFDCSNVGPNSVILTVTDEAGNTDSCLATVTVEDNIAPALNTQNITVSLDESGNVSLEPEDLVASSLDNCAEPSITVSQSDFDCAELGENTIEVTSTDVNGNAISENAIVTVVDGVNPTAVCQEITISLTETGDVTITATDVDGGSFDNCSVVNMAIDTEYFDSSNLGENIVVLTVTDQSGNTDDCQTIVTIVDTTPPTALCQNVTISLGASGMASISAADVDGGSSDNGGIATLSVSQTDFNCADLGENTVVLTVEDFDGNVATCEAIVSVIDEIAPQITECVEDKSFSLDVNCEFEMPSYLDDFEFFDNCVDWDSASIIQSPAAGEVFSGTQIIAVSISVTDSSGLTDVCEFTITLSDDTPPVIECYANQEFTTDSGSCDAVITFEPPIYSDACGIDTISLTQGLPSGSAFPLGETFMEWTAVDMNGNIATCAYTITVSDEELPIIECYENQTMEADENCQAVVEDYLSGLVVTDNCTADLTLTQTPVPGTVFSGSTSIIIYAEDSSGNVQTCEFTIEVIDTTYPTLICPENIIQAEPVVNYELPVYSDNCSAEMTLVDGLETGSEFPHGISEVFYQVEDSSGNMTECSFMVLVNQAPLGDSDSSFVDSWIEDINIEVISNDEDPDNDEFYITDAWTASGNTDAIYNEDGTIDYVIYNEDYCGEDELVYIICDTYGACDTVYSPVVVECFNGIIIPEGFSPNNDGTNDFLEIKGIQHFPNNTVAIFNRWGHKLYSMEGYMNDWDGTTQSSLNLGQGVLPEATYFIVLDLGDGSPPLKSYLYLNR